MDMVSTLATFIQLLLIPSFVFSLLFYYYTSRLSSDKNSSIQNTDFVRFQWIYCKPYFLALFSDWLQGPFVYRLYEHYGFVQSQIAVLYLVGFASSICFGTATGPIADKFGRRLWALIFCLVYSFCCLTKLSSSFTFLLIGRLFGGISTSILFSVFESWYIHQHCVANQFPIEWLSNTFSKTTFYNGLLAIGAGIAADIVADRLEYGPVAPFMLAIPFLLTAFIVIKLNWSENYGSQQLNFAPSCYEGLTTILKNPVILVLGLVQSIFESNMYIFVFLWTPVLSEGRPPLGLTFALFMIAIMIGSSLYTWLLNRFGWKSEHVLVLVMFLSSVSLLVCSLLTSASQSDKSTLRLFCILLMFLLLELSVGLYFPSISTLRGQVIPEEYRANITNWFRAPMNLLTCSGLIWINQMNLNADVNGNKMLFGFCGVTSLIGLVLAKWFVNKKSDKFRVSSTEDVVEFDREKLVSNGREVV